MSGRPVKMVMTREEVFIGSGPTSGGSLTVKVGVTKDGTIVAAETEIKLQAGPFGGSPIQPACMCAFACYDIENVKIVGYDVAVNRPRVAAYRAPGSPISAFGVESTIDLVARELGLDPIEFRLKNAAREGTQAAYGPRFPVIGNIEQLKAVQSHPNIKAKLGENQGRGIASGFWFNIGGDSSAQVNINEDGTVVLATGSPDIGGSRASMAAMAAEVLGIDYDRVRPIVADTSSVGYTFLTGGSRVTFSTGMATVQASQEATRELCARAAKVWEVEPDQVVWEDGHARPASANVGDFEPMSLAQIAADTTRTGGPIGGRASITAQGAGAGFGTHVCDVEVDRETGKVTVLRYTVAQDVGKAISPDYVEGQLQGGAAQGIGWALNEEYVYDAEGHMENPGFLDYRIPVASDLPMIDTVVVEIPNPTHPYGVRGVGEVPICPPLAAVANAVHDAIGIRMTDLPLSPPKIRAAIDAEG
jgi:CO/xanthine dehydrogenase Mo-binding subunit